MKRLNGHSSPRARQQWHKETEQQRQNPILQGLAQGYCRKEIASDLGISEKTLEYHWAQIQKRFGVNDSFRIALKAQKAGII